MNRNDFLRQFMEMRQAVAPTPAAAVAAARTAPASKAAKSMSKIREVMNGTISHIIEEKPGKKVVMEYFQKMCDELTATKMA